MTSIFESRKDEPVPDAAAPESPNKCAQFSYHAFAQMGNNKY